MAILKYDEFDMDKTGLNGTSSLWHLLRPYNFGMVAPFAFKPSPSFSLWSSLHETLMRRVKWEDKDFNLDIRDGETALGEVDKIEVLLFDWPVISF